MKIIMLVPEVKRMGLKPAKLMDRARLGPRISSQIIAEPFPPQSFSQAHPTRFI